MDGNGHGGAGGPACVLGLGRSGEAAARLLLAGGAAVTVLDAADTPALRVRAGALRAAGAEVRLGAGPGLPDGAARCVVSPGVPADAPWLAAARARGLEVLPEFELGWRRRRSRVLAVTGSNGKSTAVKWLAESLRAAGRTARPAGNYGLPVSEAVGLDPPPDWLVLEVSSFQLETAVAFRPEAGALLNLQPNHFDRHPDMASYRRAKARLFARMGPEQTAVVPAALREALAADAAPGSPRWVTFGDPPADFAFGAGTVSGPGGLAVSVAGTYFDNPVLGPTAAAVVALLRAAEADPAAAAAAARTFEPLPHRLQLVAECGGVAYIDDSKATSLAAMAAALRVVSRPAWLIAGGRLKEQDLAPPKELLAPHVRHVYLIGEAAGRLCEAWSPRVRCTVCGTLGAAVGEARRAAAPGGAVLLSPGCASFDQFGGYAERGEAFARRVRELCLPGGAENTKAS